MSPLDPRPAAPRSQKSQASETYHLLLGELHHHLVRQLLLSQQLGLLLLVLVINALNLSLHLEFLLVPPFHVLPSEEREPPSRRGHDPETRGQKDRDTEAGARTPPACQLPPLALAKQLLQASPMTPRSQMASLQSAPTWLGGSPNSDDFYTLSGKWRLLKFSPVSPTCHAKSYPLFLVFSPAFNFLLFVKP